MSKHVSRIFGGLTAVVMVMLLVPSSALAQGASQKFEKLVYLRPVVGGLLVLAGFAAIDRIVRGHEENQTRRRNLGYGGGLAIAVGIFLATSIDIDRIVW